MDTRCLRPLREAREWRKAVAQVGETALFTGMKDMLAEIRERKIAIAVVTTSVSFYAGAVLKAHGIACDVLVAYHDAPRKPLPNGVDLALTKLGLIPSEAFGVGDLATDHQAYRAARLFAVGAGWSPDFQPAGWDAVAPVPGSLSEYLDR